MLQHRACGVIFVNDRAGDGTVPSLPFDETDLDVQSVHWECLLARVLMAQVAVMMVDPSVWTVGKNQTLVGQMMLGAPPISGFNRDWPWTQVVPAYSSRGPTSDGRVKPDIVVTGVRWLPCERRNVSRICVGAHVRRGRVVLQLRHVTQHARSRY